MDVRIVGTGSAVPKRRVTNEELSEFLDTSDAWIKSRTGIESRHLAVEETTTGMAAEAAKKALADAGILPEQLDLIIAATTTPDRLLPNLACEVQSALGACHAVAFDLSAACSGFLFAMDVAYRYLTGGGGRRALIIGAETLSKIMDWSDRSTCVLFGDGAGAAVLEAQDTAARKVCGTAPGTQEAASGEDALLSGRRGILSTVLGSDGARGMGLRCDNRPVCNPYAHGKEGLPYVSMNGQEVYKFAVKTVPEVIADAVERAGLSMEEIDFFLLHQANYRIIEAVAKRLHQPMEKFPTNLQEYGNISSASVAILLDNVNNHGMIGEGSRIVLAGFGAGLTWGAAVLLW